MSLGKRPRGPMRRTTSMKEITVDLSSSIDEHNLQSNEKDFQKMGLENSARNYVDGFDTRYLSMVSPRNLHPRRSSMDFVETPSFLRACSLCNRRLGTGRDIYMYRYITISPVFFFFFLSSSSWLFLKFSFYIKTIVREDAEARIL